MQTKKETIPAFSESEHGGRWYFSSEWAETHCDFTDLHFLHKTLAGNVDSPFAKNI